MVQIKGQHTIWLLLMSAIGFDIASAKLAPDFIHPCNEPTRECLVAATQAAVPGFVKGMPGLGIASIDPLKIDELEIPLNDLTITLIDGEMRGFKTCIIDDVVSELVKRFFSIDFHCNLTYSGQYKALGKLLAFPIEGDGKAVLELTNFRMHLDMNTKYTKDKNGANHFSIKDYKYTYDYGDKMTFDIENIFKQNKEISAKIVEFMNQEWKMVAEEFGKPIVDFLFKIVVKYCQKFFSKVPYEELIKVPLPE